MLGGQTSTYEKSAEVPSAMVDVGQPLHISGFAQAPCWCLTCTPWRLPLLLPPPAPLYPPDPLTKGSKLTTSPLEVPPVLLRRLRGPPRRREREGELGSGSHVSFWANFEGESN